MTEVTYDKACSEVFPGIKTTIESWFGEKSGPAQGTYALKETDNKTYYWATRKTPTRAFVDDVIFVLFEMSATQCKVTGKSRSQSESYYDYETNYCNMWNVLDRSGGTDKINKVTLLQCPWVPVDPASRCAKY